MGTSSSISVLNKDGTVDSVYCQFDGYLSGNGLVLFLYYSNLEKIKKLVSMGSITSLCEEIDIPPGVKHNYYEKHPGITCFLHRDMHAYIVDPDGNKVDKPVQKHHVASLQDFIADPEDKFTMEYDYIFDEEKLTWFILDYKSKKLKKLLPALKADKHCLKDEEFKLFLTANEEVKKISKVLPLKMEKVKVRAKDKKI